MKIEELQKNEAILKLKKLIQISRVHFYKPIQIAEILFHHRTENSINLEKIETYRNISKKWRDKITLKLVGSVSISSQKFQDNIFEENAIPPSVLNKLGQINLKNGVVENYVYKTISKKFENISKIINLCKNKNKFSLEKLLEISRSSNDLKRSIDKIYEVVVYCLFSEILINIDLKINLEIKSKNIIHKYKDFNDSLLAFDTKNKINAKVFRAGVANAADGGIDLWSNFGWVIQVKHLILNKEIYDKIIQRQDGEKIIIVCKDIDERFKKDFKRIKNKRINIFIEKDLISLFGIIMEDDELSKNVLKNITDNLKIEFPMIGNKKEIDKLFQSRGYQF